jgi:ferric-dicitrate binding protein FerR (iron transport regulator)
MKKENNIDFISLLQDETFLNLVKDSRGLENQLDLLEQKYPANREAITYALEFIEANLSEQKKIHANEAAQILQNIKDYSMQKQRSVFLRFFTHDVWKVAAIVVLIFASSIVIYQHLNKETLNSFATKETVDGNEAILILSDGSKYKLDEDDSKIEYSTDGGNVVVRNKREQDEKLKNNHDTKGAVINQIIVPAGHRHTVSLSDGTMVVLNSGSKLVFPADFVEKTREVYLVGEGYFEVSKNPQKPFIVKTDKMDIRVLGTKFNISAYADEKVTSTVLVEGSVSVIQNGKFLGNTTKKLIPNQGYFYSSETLMSEIKQVDVADYVSWKDGLFRFKDQPLHNVVQRVCKYYNKNILIEGNKLPEVLISGKLVLSDDISVLMNYLTKTLEVRYELKADGTYVIKE